MGIDVQFFFEVPDPRAAIRQLSERFSLADIVIGTFAKRWFGIDGIERPALPNLERWYSRLATREGFRKYIDLPLT